MSHSNLLYLLISPSGLVGMYDNYERAAICLLQEVKNSNIPKKEVESSIKLLAYYANTNILVNEIFYSYRKKDLIKRVNNRSPIDNLLSVINKNIALYSLPLGSSNYHSQSSHKTEVSVKQEESVLKDTESHSDSNKEQDIDIKDLIQQEEEEINDLIDILDENDLDDLEDDPEMMRLLEEQLEKMEQEEKETKKKLKEIKKEFKKEEKIYQKQSSQFQNERLKVEKEKERWREFQNKFPVDKGMYLKFKKKIDHQKMTKEQVPSIFQREFAIFWLLDNRKILHTPQEMDIYYQIYQSMKSDELAEKISDYVPHNVNYVVDDDNSNREISEVESDDDISSSDESGNSESDNRESENSRIEIDIDYESDVSEYNFNNGELITGGTSVPSQMSMFNS